MGGGQRHYESREKSLLHHNNFQSDFLPQILLRNKSSERYESSYISVFVDNTWKVLSKYHHFHFIHHTVAHKSLIPTIKIPLKKLSNNRKSKNEEKGLVICDEMEGRTRFFKEKLKIKILKQSLISHLTSTLRDLLASKGLLLGA